MSYLFKKQIRIQKLCNNLTNLIFNNDRVFKLSTTTVILCRHRPSIWPHKCLTTSFYKHGFNGEDLIYELLQRYFPTLHHLSTIVVLKMENVRQHMHISTNSMTTIIPHSIP